MSTIWVSIVVAVIAGISAGCVAPLLTASLTRYNWRLQKRLELKYEIFRGATAALAANLADGHDIELQVKKPTTAGGMVHVVEIRHQTAQALDQHRGLLAAFFTDDVHTKFDSAARANVSIGDTPKTDFEDKRIAFIEAASAELKI